MEIQIHDQIHIFPIPEIDSIILDFLDVIEDGKNLMLVNKYYCRIIGEIPTFIELKKFYVTTDNHHVIYNGTPCIKFNKSQEKFIISCLLDYFLTAQYLLKKYTDEINFLLMIDITLYYVCSKNFIRIVKWMIESSSQMITENNQYISFRDSCCNGNLEIAKYLLNLYGLPNRIDIHQKDELIFRFCCERGHFEIVKYLISLEKSHGKINIHEYNDVAFKLCCKNGHLEIAKYLISLGDTHGKIFIDDTFLLRDCCTKNKKEIVEYLVSLENNYHYDKIEAFVSCCSVGFIEISKKLCFIYGINFHLGLKNAFSNAFKMSCKNGHIEVVKWLHDLSLENEQLINIDLIPIFKDVCKNGHLDVAKFLHQMNLDTQITSLKSEPLITRECMQKSFKSSCLNNKLEVAQWIYSLHLGHGNKININRNDDEIFRQSCSLGYLQVAQWLYYQTTAINHLACYKYAFRLSCTNQHVKVAEWLCSLSPKKYHLVVVDGKIMSWNVCDISLRSAAKPQLRFNYC